MYLQMVPHTVYLIVDTNICTIDLMMVLSLCDPLNGDVEFGCTNTTEQVGMLFFSTNGGFTRGQIRGSVKLDISDKSE